MCMLINVCLWDFGVVCYVVIGGRHNLLLTCTNYNFVVLYLGRWVTDSDCRLLILSFLICAICKVVVRTEWDNPRKTLGTAPGTWKVPSMCHVDDVDVSGPWVPTLNGSYHWVWGNASEWEFLITECQVQNTYPALRHDLPNDLSCTSPPSARGRRHHSLFITVN